MNFVIKDNFIMKDNPLKKDGNKNMRLVLIASYVSSDLIFKLELLKKKSEDKFGFFS